MQQKSLYRCNSPRLGLVALLAVFPLLAVACAGGARTDAGGSPGRESVTVAFTAPIVPTYVNTAYGPVKYGDDFGLTISQQNLLVFESHSTATQIVLSGRADIVGGSFMSTLLARQQGLDLKAFCPFLNLDDFVVAGSGQVDSLKDLFRPSTKVSIDGKGGAARAVLNAILLASDAPGMVGDMSELRILGSSGTRTSAFASGKVDATLIHLSQFRDAKAQVESPAIVASLADSVPRYINHAFAAPKDWLDSNTENAARFCASVLKANRELKKGFGSYQNAVEEFVEEPPKEKALRGVFRYIQEYNFWPTDGGLRPDSLRFMVNLGARSGILEERPELGSIVDRGVLRRAVELVDKQMQE